VKQLPEHGPCFVCGTANPRSIGITWFLNDDGSVYTEFTFDLSQQGPPEHVHGGASAAVLDEAMGAAVWRAGYSVAAVNLEINYKQPVPLGVKITIEARVSKVLPRKVFTSGEMRLPDGAVAVTGRGIYVPAPHLFEKVRFGK
jgi:uncharacterized protein (TIGR00369 family)